MKPRIFNNCIFVNKKLRIEKVKRREKVIYLLFTLEVFLNNHKGFWYNDVCFL